MGTSILETKLHKALTHSSTNYIFILLINHLHNCNLCINHVMLLASVSTLTCCTSRNSIMYAVLEANLPTDFVIKVN